MARFEVVLRTCRFQVRAIHASIPSVALLEVDLKISVADREFIDWALRSLVVIDDKV